MAKLEIIEVTRQELDSGTLPFNHVLVESEVSLEGAKTKGGVIVGILEDTVFGAGDNSLAADMTINHGIVYKTPERLYYNEDDPINSLPWKCEQELIIGDRVWFSIIEAYNATTLKCEDKFYKIIPYADCTVAKRDILVEPNAIAVAEIYKRTGELMLQKTFTQTICLNGYVLLTKVNCKKLSDLDTISEDKIDTSRGIVSFVGNPNQEYLQESYVDFQDLRVGDEVLLAPRTPILMLERKSYFAKFDGDNLYFVVPRRKIVAVLNRK